MTHESLQVTFLQDVLVILKRTLQTYQECLLSTTYVVMFRRFKTPTRKLHGIRCEINPLETGMALQWDIYIYFTTTKEFIVARIIIKTYENYSIDFIIYYQGYSITHYLHQKINHIRLIFIIILLICFHTKAYSQYGSFYFR